MACGECICKEVNILSWSINCVNEDCNLLIHFIWEIAGPKNTCLRECYNLANPLFNILLYYYFFSCKIVLVCF